jgi:hypothetical protein
MLDGRYLNVFEAVRDAFAKGENAENIQPCCFMEIGTHNGERANYICRKVILENPEVGRFIYYVGVDLFEDYTLDHDPILFAHEQPPPSLLEVQNKFSALVNECPEQFEFELGKGESYLYLEKDKDGLLYSTANLGFGVIFVSGGRSFETIEKDWLSLQPFIRSHTYVLFDNYYHYGSYELLSRFGCQKLISELDRSKWEINFLEPIDVLPKCKLEVGIVGVRSRAVP